MGMNEKVFYEINSFYNSNKHKRSIGINTTKSYMKILKTSWTMKIIRLNRKGTSS